MIVVASVSLGRCGTGPVRRRSWLGLAGVLIVVTSGVAAYGLNSAFGEKLATLRSKSRCKCYCQHRSRQQFSIIFFFEGRNSEALRIFPSPKPRGRLLEGVKYILVRRWQLSKLSYSNLDFFQCGKTESHFPMLRCSDFSTVMQYILPPSV